MKTLEQFLRWLQEYLRRLQPVAACLMLCCLCSCTTGELKTDGNGLDTTATNSVVNPSIDCDLYGVECQLPRKGRRE